MPCCDSTDDEFINTEETHELQGSYSLFGHQLGNIAYVCIQLLTMTMHSKTYLLQVYNNGRLAVSGPLNSYMSFIGLNRDLKYKDNTKTFISVNNSYSYECSCTPYQPLSDNDKRVCDIADLLTMAFGRKNCSHITNFTVISWINLAFCNETQVCLSLTADIKTKYANFTQEVNAQVVLVYDSIVNETYAIALYQQTGSETLSYSSDVAVEFGNSKFFHAHRYL